MVTKVVIDVDIHGYGLFRHPVSRIYFMIVEVHYVHGIVMQCVALVPVSLVSVQVDHHYSLDKLEPPQVPDCQRNVWVYAEPMLSHSDDYPPPRFSVAWW